QHSRWHRVDQDEAWHWLEGEPLDLFWIAPGFTRVEHRVLGSLPADSGIPPSRAPLVVVPGGCWQATRCDGAYALVTCTMGPGFEFDSFELLAGNPESARRLAALAPELAALV